MVMDCGPPGARAIPHPPVLAPPVAAATPDTVAETWLVTVALKVPGWASLPLSSSAVRLLSQAGKESRIARQES